MTESRLAIGARVKTSNLCSTSEQKGPLPMRIGVVKVLRALSAATVTVVMAGSSHLQAADPQPPASVSPQRALIQQYCVGCHSGGQPAGKLSLTTPDVDHVSGNPEGWEKVVRKLRAGLMPPVGMPRPDKGAYDGFA